MPLPNVFGSTYTIYSPENAVITTLWGGIEPCKTRTRLLQIRLALTDNEKGFGMIAAGVAPPLIKRKYVEKDERIDKSSHSRTHKNNSRQNEMPWKRKSVFYRSKFAFVLTGISFLWADTNFVTEPNSETHPLCDCDFCFVSHNEPVPVSYLLIHL